MRLYTLFVYKSLTFYLLIILIFYSQLSHYICRIDEDLGMDFGPDTSSSINVDDGVDKTEGSLEMKRDKTRRKMIAENRAILALIEEPNEEGKCWADQQDACSFICFLCNETVESFRNICDHMDNTHPLDSFMDEGAREESPAAVHQCIACPKRFKKKTHLKVTLLLILFQTNHQHLFSLIVQLLYASMIDCFFR